MNKRLNEAMERIAQSTRDHTGRCSPADVYEVCVVIKGILEHLSISSCNLTVVTPCCAEI